MLATLDEAILSVAAHSVLSHGEKVHTRGPQQAVENSTSIAGVLRQLDVVQSGGMHAHISRTIKKMGIDTGHFTGQGWRRNRTFPDLTPPQQILRLLPAGSPRVNGQRLRKALLKSGRRYACASCGNLRVWMMRSITLHVDHINGNYLDCRPENLRFLCPNCHSQTPTHAGKNKNRVRTTTVARGPELGVVLETRT